MKQWNQRIRNSRSLVRSNSSDKESESSRSPGRALACMLAVMLCLTCILPAFSIGAEELQEVDRLEDNASVEKNEESPLDISLKADPLQELQTSYSRIGEVLISKNVLPKPSVTPQDSSFDITLSALSSWTNVSNLLSKPLDIIMVLDTSGSMKAPFDEETSRIGALKETVGLFLDSLERSNSQIAVQSSKSRVGIITFNDAAAVEMPLTDNVSNLRECVSNLKEFGVTRSNLGLQEGLKMVRGSLSDNRSKVVIFFTDGMPSDGYGFTRTIANEAVEAADAIRKNDSLIYSVGIFPGSDPNADVKLVSGRENTNRFMQAVSSNYPDASSYSGTLGKKASSQYYLSAANHDELERSFDYIFKTMDGGSGYPTETDPAHPDSSGYVSLHDTLGAWMSIPSAPVLNANGKNYLPVSSRQEGDTITYSYQGMVPANVPSTTADLSSVIVRVRKAGGTGGDSLEVRLPAALLPLDVYSLLDRSRIQPDPDHTELSIRHALPFSVSFTAELNSPIKQALAGRKTEESLQAAAWLDEFNPAAFYSNSWNDSEATWADFTPAKNNQFYHNESTDPIRLQTTAKPENITQTLPEQTRLKKLDQSANPSYRLELGNNGRLDLQMQNSVTVSKNVLSAGEYPAPGVPFTFEASLTDSQGNPWSGMATVRDFSGKTGSLHFSGGKATFVLEDNQTMTFLNLPLFSSFQAEEKAADGFTAAVQSPKAEKTVSSLSAPVEIHPGTKTEINFINTYTLQPITLLPAQSGLTVEKILSGRSWTEQDVFDFTISALSPEDAPLPEKTTIQICGIQAEKTADFGAVQFDAPGIYTYLITENSSSEALLPGVSYSAALYEVSITVTDQGNGTLQAALPVIRKIHDDQGNNTDIRVSSILFENRYSAQETSVVPMVRKQIDAFCSADPVREKVIVPPANDLFTFSLKALDVDAPMPEGTDEQTIRTSNHGEVVEFPAIVFHQSDIGKIFRYEISEEAVSSIPGMSSSPETIILEVAVTRAQINGAETVVASSRYLNKEGQPLSYENTVLTNHYVYSPAQALITGSKTLTGRDMKDGEFSFEIFAADAVTQQAMDQGEIILPDPSAEAGASEDGKPSYFRFENLQFTRPGEYTFVVAELQNDLPGVILDDSLHYIRIRVIHNPAEAALEAEIRYQNLEDAAAGCVQFENTYIPIFNEASAVSLSGEKIVEDPYGDSYLRDSQFLFRLLAPDGSESLLTSPQGVFSVLENQIFSKAGTYTYQLQEIPFVSGYPQEAMIFDNSLYTIEIEVEDNGQGSLIAQPVRLFKNSEAVSSIIFTNTVQPLPAEAAALPAAQKQLAGRELQENEFEFIWSLNSDAGNGVLAGGGIWNTPQTVTNTADGSVPFFADSLTFTKPGHYEITLKEQAGTQPGITYDKSILTWSYEVRAEQGQLVLEDVWPDRPVFSNSWTSSSSKAVSIPLQARKELKNGQLQADEFTFELVENDRVIQTKHNDSTGAVQFDPLIFQAEGEYFFTLREKAGGRANIDYDQSQYRIHISVWKDQQGSLKARVVREKPLIFVNWKKTSPATGTRSNLSLWITVACLALCGLIIANKKNTD